MLDPQTLSQLRQTVGIGGTKQDQNTTQPVSGIDFGSWDNEIQSKQQVGEQQSQGFKLSDIPKAILEPFAKLGVSGVNVVDAISKLAQGDAQGAHDAINKERNVPFLGKTEPAFNGQENLGEAGKKALGYGLDIGTTLMPGVGVGADIAKTAGKTALETGLKKAGDIAVQGAITGAGTSAGKKLEEGGTMTQAFGSGLLGAAGGAALGLGGKLIATGLNKAGSKILSTVTGKVPALDETMQGIAKEVKGAIRPTIGANRAGFDDNLNTTLHVISDAGVDTSKVTDLSSLKSVIDDTRTKLMSEVNSKMGKGIEKGFTINGDVIKNDLNSILNKGELAAKLNYLEPGLKSKLLKQIDTIATEQKPVLNSSTGQPIVGKDMKIQMSNQAKQIPIQDAENLIKSLNAELEPYYTNNKTSKVLTLRSNPEMAMKVQLADTLRREIDKQLDDAGTSSGFNALRKTWGALTNISNQIDERSMKLENLNPKSLQETLNFAQAAGRAGEHLLSGEPGSIKRAVGTVAQPITSKILKTVNDPNYRIGKAFEKLNASKK